MGSARKVDRNGYMMVERCPISSFGIFDYSAGQIGLDGDPDRIVKVYRPEAAINNARTIDSLKNLPFIDDHEFLSGNDDDVTNPEDYGVEGITTSNVAYSKPWLLADIKVFSKSMRQSLDSGKTEVSLGFDCDYILQPGSFDGEDYEVIQDNIIGNHLALVDVARVQGARVLDGRAFDYMRFDILPQKRKDDMTTKVKGRGADSTAVELLKKLVPALSQFLKEEEGEPAHQNEMEGGAQIDDEHAAVADPSTIEQAKEGDDLAAAEPGGEGGQVEAAPAEGGESELVTLLKQLVVELQKQLGQGADEEGKEGQDGEVAMDEVCKDGTTPTGGEVALDNQETGAEEVMSQGPKGGENAKAADAAIRKSIYEDMAKRDRLYKRVSPIIGAFDCATMSCDDLAEYSAKKLGLNVNRNIAATAVDAYLMGSQRSTNTAKAKAADSVVTHDAIESYINGGK